MNIPSPHLVVDSFQNFDRVGRNIESIPTGFEYNWYAHHEGTTRCRALDFVRASLTAAFDAALAGMP